MVHAHEAGDLVIHDRECDAGDSHCTPSYTCVRLVCVGLNDAVFSIEHVTTYLFAADTCTPRPRGLVTFGIDERNPRVAK